MVVAGSTPQLYSWRSKSCHLHGFVLRIVALTRASQNTLESNPWFTGTVYQDAAPRSAVISRDK
eukprot:3502659-Amphidinium_carterae.1